MGHRSGGRLVHPHSSDLVVGDPVHPVETGDGTDIPWADRCTLHSFHGSSGERKNHSAHTANMNVFIGHLV